MALNSQQVIELCREKMRQQWRKTNYGAIRGAIYRETGVDIPLATLSHMGNTSRCVASKTALPLAQFLAIDVATIAQYGIDGRRGRPKKQPENRESFNSGVDRCIAENSKFSNQLARAWITSPPLTGGAS